VKRTGLIRSLSISQSQYSCRAADEEMNGQDISLYLSYLIIPDLFTIYCKKPFMYLILYDFTLSDYLNMWSSVWCDPLISIFSKARFPNPFYA